MTDELKEAKKSLEAKAFEIEELLGRNGYTLEDHVQIRINQDRDGIFAFRFDVSILAKV